MNEFGEGSEQAVGQQETAAQSSVRWTGEKVFGALKGNGYLVAAAGAGVYGAVEMARGNHLRGLLGGVAAYELARRGLDKNNYKLWMT